MIFPDSERGRWYPFDRDPDSMVNDLLVADRFAKEVLNRRQTFYVGPDVGIVAQGQELASGMMDKFRLRIPYGHLRGLGVTDRKIEELFAIHMVGFRFTSVRSKLAQAGIGSVLVDRPMNTPITRVQIKEEKDYFEIPVVLIGYNSTRRLLFPETGTLPFLRFYVPSGQLYGADLFEATRSMVAGSDTQGEVWLRSFDGTTTSLAEAKGLAADDQHFNLESERVFSSISVPIVRHGHFEGSGVINLAELNAKMERTKLDEIFRVNWDVSSAEATKHVREFYLGETGPVKFNGFAGTVITGSEGIAPHTQWLHADSTVVDDGFKGAIRTEEAVDAFIGSKRVLPAYVHLFLYRS